jgi:hypothetical protein
VSKLNTVVKTLEALQEVNIHCGPFSRQYKLFMCSVLEEIASAVDAWFKQAVTSSVPINCVITGRRACNVLLIWEQTALQVLVDVDEDVNRAWENIKENIETSAKESLGLHKLNHGLIKNV